jgi:hypothetical protein
MPSIIPYSLVLEGMTAMGMRCVYFNAGAFAFTGDQPVSIVGWIGPDDASIRPDLPATLVRVDPPYGLNLAKKLVVAIARHLTGLVWVVPKSHWSFELTHSHGGWLSNALLQAGLSEADIARLAPLTSAAAIAFQPDEIDSLGGLVEALLDHLQASDFAILFPNHPHLVTVHHHKQLWWQTGDTELAAILGS